MPGPFTGQYSRRIFDEGKHYAGIMQMASFTGAPRAWVDADINDGFMIQLRNLQRAVMDGHGDGTHSSSAWKIVENVGDTTNNFRVSTDSPMLRDGYWVGGLRAFLAMNMPYTVEWDPGADEFHHRSTALAGLTLSDTSCKFSPGLLIGRRLVPDVTQSEKTWLITGNTRTTITVQDDNNPPLGNMDAVGNAEAGDIYYVTLTMPVVARTDSVYLDVFLDEVDHNDDPNLDHGMNAGGGAGVALGANRLKVQANLIVNEGGLGYAIPNDHDKGPYYRTYTDSNGELHWIAKIATIKRLGLDNTITTAMITDERTLVWGMQAVRDGIVGPDHVAVDVKRRFDEVRTCTTVGDGVTTWGDYNGEKGLRDAVAAAAQGDCIVVKPGTYTMTDVIKVTKGLTIKGDKGEGGLLGAWTPTLVKAANKSIFDVTGSDVTLEGMSLKCTVDAVGYGVEVGTGTVVERFKAKGLVFVDDYIVKAAIRIGDGEGGTGLSGIVIEDCFFNSDNQVAGIWIKSAVGASSGQIVRCVFALANAGGSDDDYHIYIDNSGTARDLRITDCRFRGTAAADGRGGIYATEDSFQNVTIEGCEFRYLARSAIQVREGNDDWVIRDCRFTVTLEDGCIHFRDGSGLGKDSRSLLIDNCRFDAPSGVVDTSWVELDNVSDSTVRSCTFDIPSGGAAPAGSSILAMNSAIDGGDGRNIISGNSFEGDHNLTSCVNVSGKGVLVQGNHFRAAGVAVDAISVSADECRIIGNHIRSCDIGIAMVGVVGAIISDNDIESCTGIGITAPAGNHDVVLRGNVIRNNNGGAGNVQVLISGDCDGWLVEGNNCSVGGVQGKIDGGDVGTCIFRNNLARITNDHVSLFPARAFYNASSYDEGPDQPFLDYAAGDDNHYVSPYTLDVIAQGRVPLTAGHVPHGAFVTKLALRGMANDPQDYVKLVLYAYDYATNTQQWSETLSSVPAALPLEQEIEVTLGVPRQINHHTHYYVLGCHLYAHIGVQTDARLHCAKVTYELAEHIA